MSGVEMRRIGQCFIFNLYLIEIFNFPQSVFINSSKRFGQISIHITISHIKVSIIGMQNPRKDRVLRKIVKRPPCEHIDYIEIVNVRYFP